MSVSCEGYEHRVVLSSVGFSRGVHYWELTIDRYHSDTDPAFGIARADVSRDQMLGKSSSIFSRLLLRSWKGKCAVHPVPMKYSCATRYIAEISGLFSDSKARGTCVSFSFSFLLSPSLAFTTHVSYIFSEIRKRADCSCA